MDDVARRNGNITYQHAGAPRASGARAMAVRACVALVCAACAAGCTISNWNDPYWHSPNGDERTAAFLKTETQLAAAREHASVVCDTQDACDRFWARTRAYVVEHSPTRIRRADDSVIETARPYEFGIAYFRAERATHDDGSTRISLKGLCRGMYNGAGGPGWTYSLCAPQIEAAEAAFQQTIEQPG
ncbi:hypothetical protein [Paraburkholderia rhizosphaerae]|uniref:Uncharacterized protein n=1 Tax=Paraburkholderia rhizosphaerae TaxID=480658 RepID=A0A4R8LTE9_9BURK|nr:hypothetical protein [Paraburkholderia rhizosphaerae]TDY50973.1 hypothetical protein BX592_108210 [Paraburkholderia rhizosphaerae]